MKRLITAALLLAFAMPAYPHAGEVHTYMGTVTAVTEDGSFTLKTTEGKVVPVATSTSTVYEYADGSKASLADVTVRARAVVTMAKDGKTATLIKLGRKRS